MSTCSVCKTVGTHRFQGTFWVIQRLTWRITLPIRRDYSPGLFVENIWRDSPCPRCRRLLYLTALKGGLSNQQWYSLRNRQFGRIEWAFSA